MDKLARRVAARWAFRVAMEGYNPPIPAWVFEWGNRSLRLAYVDTKHQPGLVHDILDDEKIFKEARDSLEILLPKLLDLLYRTFKDRFHMNASGGKSRIFYYFATKDPLENIALTLGIKAHMPYLSMMYVPTALHGGADYKRGIEFKEVVEDPELAGLTMMRLARKLLSHAMPTPKHAARRSAA